MKTILYATDYSENSVAALKYAYNMSLKINAKLLAVHVFDNPTIMRTKQEGTIPDIEKDSFKAHNAKLVEFCKKHLGSDLNKMNVKVEAIQHKSEVNGIASKANEIEALLIITGMKGAGKLRKYIMGSTANDLIEKAPCPVLTIPEDTNYKMINTIVYATAFEEEDFGAINKLAEIAKPFNAKIRVVHVSPLAVPVEAKYKKVLEEKINKRVEYKNVKLDILYSDDIFNELKTCFDKVNADIIAMLERESDSLSSGLFYPNLVKKMKSYGKIPLMSFNAKNYGIFHL